MGATMKFRMFSAQHIELADIARDIVAHVSALANGTGAAARDPLPALRLAFSRAGGAHCSAEIDCLREHLQSHPDVAAERADMIRRFHDELLAWRGSLMDCNAHWPARRVVESPAAFLDVFTPLADALYARLRWEEQEFYPKVLGRKPVSA